MAATSSVWRGGVRVGGGAVAALPLQESGDCRNGLGQFLNLVFEPAYALVEGAGL